MLDVQGQLKRVVVIQNEFKVTCSEGCSDAAAWYRIGTNEHVTVLADLIYPLPVVCDLKLRYHLLFGMKIPVNSAGFAESTKSASLIWLCAGGVANSV